MPLMMPDRPVPDGIAPVFSVYRATDRARRAVLLDEVAVERIG